MLNCKRQEQHQVKSPQRPRQTTANSNRLLRPCACARTSNGHSYELSPPSRSKKLLSDSAAYKTCKHMIHIYMHIYTAMQHLKKSLHRAGAPRPPLHGHGQICITLKSILVHGSHSQYFLIGLTDMGCLVGTKLQDYKREPYGHGYESVNEANVDSSSRKYAGQTHGPPKCCH